MAQIFTQSFLYVCFRMKISGKWEGHGIMGVNRPEKSEGILINKCIGGSQNCDI